MADEDIAHGDFAVVPSADHTYALDNFPTDEVPNVFAFEEVKSQRKMPQSLFSIVEEHAYAYRDENMMADEWSNLPGMNTEPQGVDVGTQTESSVPIIDQDKIDEREDYFSALSTVEKSIRMVTLTVSRSLIQTLELAASFLHLSLTVKGNKVRMSKVSDLLRILMCSPKFSSAPHTSQATVPPQVTPQHRSSLPVTTHELSTSSFSTSEPQRDTSLTRSGRMASKFSLAVHHNKEEVKEDFVEQEENVKERVRYQCPCCHLSLSSSSCLTRHMRCVHEPSDPKFACDQCPAKYKRRDTLLEHQAMKHDRESKGKYMFKCKHCFRAFKRQTLLTDHLNTHTGVRTHGCSFCDQRFHGRAVLRYHLKNVHNVTAASLKQLEHGN